MKAPNKLKSPSIYFIIKLGSGKRPNMGGFRNNRASRKPEPCAIYRGLAAIVHSEGK